MTENFGVAFSVLLSIFLKQQIRCARKGTEGGGGEEGEEEDDYDEGVFCCLTSNQ